MFWKMFSVFLQFLDDSSQTKADLPVIRFQIFDSLFSACRVLQRELGKQGI